ncbi:MAG: DNRLRE domain-containing protein [Methanocellales archaeon]|nr:DNRLRE domain-containing protein [Methanocellales archaeon]
MLSIFAIFATPASANDSPAIIYPTDDTCVQSNEASSPHDDKNLHIKKDGSKIRRAYVKFDLSSLPNGIAISSATLKLYRYEGDKTAREIGVYTVSKNYADTDIPWTEDGLTWNNAPTDFSLTDITSVGDPDGWKAWDISSAAQAAYNSDKILSLALKFVDETSDRHQDFRDMEHGGTDKNPYIEVTCTVADTTPPTFIVSASPDPAKEGLVTITVIASEALSEPPTVIVTQAGGTPTPVTMTLIGDNTYTGAYTVVTGYDGTAAIDVYGSDLAGNEGIGEGGFVVDTTVPTLIADLAATNTAFSPGNDDGIQETTDFSFTAGEDGTYTFTISDGVVCRTFSGSCTAGVAVVSTWDGTADDGTTQLAEGTWSTSVTVTDAAGNSITGATLSITIDNTAPSIASVTHDATTTLVAGDTVIVTLAGDPGEIATCDIGAIITGAAMTESEVMPGSYTYAYTILAGDDGTHTVTGRLTDAAGNIASSKAASGVTVDTIAPNAPTSLTATALITGDIDLSWTAPTAASDGDIASSYNVYRDTISNPATRALLQSGVTTTTWTDTTVVEGTTYYYVVTAVDDAGNEGAESNEASATSDVTKPTVTITLSDPSPTKAGTVTFTLTFSEGMDQTVDPTVTFGLISPYDAHTVTGSWTSATVWAGTFNITTCTGDGLNTISVSGAKDLAGNMMEPDTTYTFVIDTMAPTTTTIIGALKYGEEPTYVKSITAFTLSADDGSGSGVASTEYNVDGGAWTAYMSGFSVTTAGEHTVNYRSTDAAGNVEDTKSLAIYVDDVPPTTTDDADGDWHNTDVTITLSVADIGSGVSETYYTTDGSDPITSATRTLYTAPFILTETGQYQLMYYSVDNVGNAEAVVTGTLVRIDKIAPSTSDDVPADWQISPFTIILTVADVGGSPTVTHYKIWLSSGDEPASYAEGNTISVYVDGEYYVKYYTSDEAGNVETARMATYTAKLDTVAPTGMIAINDGAAYTTSVDVTLSLTYSDDTSGVYQVRYSNDGVWDIEAWESAMSTKSWTLTSGDGTKIVYYQTKDNAGLESETCSDDITLDNTPPTASITEPMDDAYIRGSVNINGTASDANIKEYKVEQWNGTIWTEITTSTTPVTDGTLATWDTSEVDDGSYRIILTVTDDAANTNTTEINVTVDNTPPVIINVMHTTITHDSVTITWNTDEPADSLVLYGTVSGNYMMNVTNATEVTSHIIDLTGLTVSTTYYYVVNSTDPSGSSNQSGEYNFTTVTPTPTPTPTPAPAPAGGGGYVAPAAMPTPTPTPTPMPTRTPRLVPTPTPTPTPMVMPTPEELAPMIKPMNMRLIGGLTTIPVLGGMLAYYLLKKYQESKIMKKLFP